MDDAKTLAAQARISVSEIGYRFGAKQSAVGFIDRLAALAASHQAEVERLTDDHDSWRDQASARTDDALRFAAECTEAYGARDAAIERANFMHGFAREAQELASKAQEDTRRLAAERDALRKDAAALDWLRDNLFTHHWNAVIGPGWRVDWKVVPHYRHIRLYDESGNAGGDFREAIRRAALADAQGAQT